MPKQSNYIIPYFFEKSINLSDKDLIYFFTSTNLIKKTSHSTLHIAILIYRLTELNKMNFFRSCEKDLSKRSKKSISTSHNSLKDLIKSGIVCRKKIKDFYKYKFNIDIFSNYKKG